MVGMVLVWFIWIGVIHSDAFWIILLEDYLNLSG
jgi:hypothetical protein